VQVDRWVWSAYVLSAWVAGPQRGTRFRLSPIAGTFSTWCLSTIVLLQSVAQKYTISKMFVPVSSADLRRRRGVFVRTPEPPLATGIGCFNYINLSGSQNFCSTRSRRSMNWSLHPILLAFLDQHFLTKKLWIWGLPYKAEHLQCMVPAFVDFSTIFVLNLIHFCANFWVSFLSIFGWL
jgi:hypothetical protein